MYPKLLYVSGVFCGGCGQDKAEDQFNWQNRVAGVRHRLCNECRNANRRVAYEQSPGTYSSRVLSRRAETRSAIENYTRSQCCQDCGECDPDVLVFDTDAGAKTPASFAASGRSYESLAPALTQLTVRCLNCQRKAERRREHSERIEGSSP